MPRFLDHHTTMPLPPEAVAQIQAQLGKRQPDGVTPIQVLVGKDQTYCIAEAANADLVHKHHEAMGIQLGPGAIEELTATLP
ncbi:MAG: DUF4242 domain-containing protein [Chloroflexi bacterium]|nr:DUF4242 domain-containing protein [Chloroflexota bacterium]